MLVYLIDLALTDFDRLGEEFCRKLRRAGFVSLLEWDKDQERWFATFRWRGHSDPITCMDAGLYRQGVVAKIVDGELRVIDSELGNRFRQAM